MTDHPLLFRGEMVKALLDGRKSQTRRPAWREAVTLPGEPPSEQQEEWELRNWKCEHQGDGRWVIAPPTAAQRIRVGDRIWVKETNALVGGCDPGLFVTRADYPQCVPREYENVPPAAAVRWTPSIHMKRIYSRLTLIVTGARIERLQEISEADAKAEGMLSRLGDSAAGYHWRGLGFHAGTFDDHGSACFHCARTDRNRCSCKVGWKTPAQCAYRELYSRIHGPDAWAENGEVVVLTFTVHKANIDSLKEAA